MVEWNLSWKRSYSVALCKINHSSSNSTTTIIISSSTTTITTTINFEKGLKILCILDIGSDFLGFSRTTGRI